MIGFSASSWFGASSAYRYTPKSGASTGTREAGSLSPAQDTTTIPVTPAARVRSVQRKPSTEMTANLSTGAELPTIREGADPVELSVRSRIQYLDPAEVTNDNMPTKVADELPKTINDALADAAKSPGDIMEDSECQTCENRKYQDGSDDPGVSYKTATHIAPEQAAAAVRGHEMEHVSHEQVKAQQEGRKVVSQTVSMHTAICPECGDVYVSGGQTRTTTMADNRAELYQQEQQQAVPLFEAIA